jgi:hypothetical protein
MSSVFARQRLTPSQARTVADRRRADASALQRLKQNRHANGAMYLAGIAVELLLKALLLEKYPWLQTNPASVLDRRQRRLRDSLLSLACFGSRVGKPSGAHRTT